MAISDTKEQLDFYREVDRGDGDVLLRAVSGSGKSTSLKQSIYRKRGVGRERVLYTAFNKAIAKEQEKAFDANVKVRTSHSFGFAALLRSKTVDPNGLDKSKVFKLAERLVDSKPYRNQFNRSRRFSLVVRLSKAVAMAKNMMADTPDKIDEAIDFSEVRTDDFPPFSRAVAALLERSNRMRTFDFDDMIYLAALRGSTGQIEVPQYDLCYFDESQDASESQQTLLDLASSNGRLIAAGDENQAIYAFRSGTSENFVKLSRRPGMTAMPLSVTWRCDAAIVAEANKYNAEIKARPGAPLGIVDKAAGVDNPAPGDMILAYRNLPVVKACVGLIRAGRRASVLGDDFAADITKIVSQVRSATAAGAVAEIERRYDKVYDARATEVGDDRAGRERWLKLLREKCSLASFMCESAGSPTQARRLISRVFDTSYDDIVCSTVHKAKGKEADRVFVLDYHDMVKASQKDQSMKNVAYVAVTRAKRHLTLIP